MQTELCLLQDACRFYTDTCIKVHSKPRLIPLLYHTRGGTLKKCVVSKSHTSLFKPARVTSLHIIMTLLTSDVITPPHLRGPLITCIYNDAAPLITCIYNDAAPLITCIYNDAAPLRPPAKGGRTAPILLLASVHC
jgi:hypothetical protein